MESWQCITEIAYELSLQYLEYQARWYIWDTRTRKNWKWVNERRTLHTYSSFYSSRIFKKNIFDMFIRWLIDAFIWWILHTFVMFTVDNLESSEESDWWMFVKGMMFVFIMILFCTWTACYKHFMTSDSITNQRIQKEKLFNAWTNNTLI